MSDDDTVNPPNLIPFHHLLLAMYDKPTMARLVDSCRVTNLPLELLSNAFETLKDQSDLIVLVVTCKLFTCLALATEQGSSSRPPAELEGLRSILLGL
jgi:hypothetical protein